MLDLPTRIGDARPRGQTMMESVEQDAIVTALRRAGGNRSRVRACEDPLAFVLVDCFDPPAEAGAVDGFRALVELASDGGRRVELLRADVAAIGFATADGTRGQRRKNGSGVVQLPEARSGTRWPP